MNDVTVTQAEETKTRTAAKKIFVIELVDHEGNVIPNASEKNIRIIKEYKKIDETIIDITKEHPHAFFVKM